MAEDSIQQASDLADEIAAAVNRLVSAVEATGLIHEGVTERTLQNLQMMLDCLTETTEEIHDESVTGPQQK
jgi:hypothetical protein